jgi:hypothetical protein
MMNWINCTVERNYYAQGEAKIPSTLQKSVPTYGYQSWLAAHYGTLKISLYFQGRIRDVWEDFQNGGFCNICSLRS